jgi:mRNA-degrading endonuclease RelE of RelBE toxin-antitoxin system
VAFTILLHPRAAKELKRIDNPARSRITERLKELKNDPETVGKALRHTDFWSLRAGDYRAIYEIHRHKKQVIVLFIGHRKKVYDDFSKLL